MANYRFYNWAILAISTVTAAQMTEIGVSYHHQQARLSIDKACLEYQDRLFRAKMEDNYDEALRFSCLVDKYCKD